MSFIIEINGKDITSIEDLRDNFDIDILLNYKDNFEDWLAGWDYYDEAAQVRELPPDLSDNAWLEQIVQILNVPVTTVDNAAQRRLQKIEQTIASKTEEIKNKKSSATDIIAAAVKSATVSAVLPVPGVDVIIFDNMLANLSELYNFDKEQVKAIVMPFVEQVIEKYSSPSWLKFVTLLGYVAEANSFRILAATLGWYIQSEFEKISIAKLKIGSDADFNFNVEKFMNFYAEYNKKNPNENTLDLTRDNITLEILPETNQKLGDIFLGTYGDTLFVTNESGWFFAPTSEKLFKSTDSGKTWERIWYDGSKIFYHNNYWITSGYDRIKFTADLKIWQDVSGPSVQGIDDKILFDGKNYIAFISALGKNEYWIWGSENLTEWRKLADYGYTFQDAIFHNKFHLLQSICSDGSGRNVCIADSLEKLCLPLKSRHCQDFVADEAGRFIGCAGEKFLLTKGINSFWVTSDFNEFHSFTGVATAVEDLIICCDADGFWVSSIGKPKTWRKMNIKPPFKIDKLAYDNGTLIMYNGDSSKVCVAKVYADDVEFIMPLEESLLEFARGFVCKGSIKQGKIKVGDFVDVCDKSEKKLISAKVLEIEQSGKKLEIANNGDKVAVLLPPEDDIFIIFAGKEGKEFILKSNSPSHKQTNRQTNDGILFKMKIDSVIFITGRGVVCSGRIEYGNIKVGDFVDIEYQGGISAAKSFKVLGIEKFHESLDKAQKGDNVGVLLNTTSTEKIRENMVIVKRG